MLRFASLASGSKGNCLVAESGGTRVLLDCGLAVRETERRLARLGLAPHELSAVLVTHEHEDHAGGAFAFAAGHRLPVYLTTGTLQALREMGLVEEGVTVRLLDGRSRVAIDGIEVRPFSVPHDAREPVQFVLSDGALRLGVLTDLGAVTPRVEAALSGCEALVLECNHDLELLWSGPYPKWLKERIAGPLGHLDNRATERLLLALDRSRLQHLLGAHLSQQNNRPELARAALARSLGCTPHWLGLATQDEGFDWRELR
jgi:phosphoribosyl 1,2-cyclic phosphodiesterase